MTALNMPPAVALDSVTKSTSIKNLPINLFGSVMGLAGLSLAWRLVSQHTAQASVIADGIGLFAGLVFALLVLGYLTKWIKHPEVVKAEFNHPVSGNFFGTVTIALLLLSAVSAPYSAVLSQALWVIGSLLTVGAGWCGGIAVAVG